MVCQQLVQNYMNLRNRKVVDGDVDGRIQANVRNKTIDSSVQESYSKRKVTIHNLIQEFTAVVFEKDELEFGDTSELKALLPLLVYQDSHPDVDIIF